MNDIEFMVGKVQAKQSETADKVFRDLNPTLQKILSELDEKDKIIKEQELEAQ